MFVLLNTQFLKAKFPLFLGSPCIYLLRTPVWYMLIVKYPPQANRGSAGHFILQEESGNLAVDGGSSFPQKHSVL